MRTPRALALAVALVGVATLGVLALAGFVTPAGEGAPGPQVNIGSVEDYAPGSVTPLVEPDAESGGAWIVRLPDGELRVFDRRSTGRGCSTYWRDPLNEPGVDAGFKDPCQLSVWQQDGTLVFGRARRDLDQFEHHVQGDGDVIVDFSRVIRGEERPNAPWGRTEVRQ